MVQCHFCGRNNRSVEWKDAETLRRFLSVAMKIKPRTKTGLCSKHQRELAHAVKRARAMGLLAFTPE